MDRPPMRDHPPAPSRTPLQFSLQTLMIITTAAAVVFSGLFAGPGWLSAITTALFMLAIPMVLTVAIVYGRGYGRTFCIGALFPAGVSLLFSIGDIGRSLSSLGILFSTVDEDGADLLVFLTVYCFLAITAGLLAMGVRKMVEGAGRQTQHEAIPDTIPAADSPPTDSEPDPFWNCVSCGKTVPVSFGFCSNCDAPRNPDYQSPDQANP